MREQDRLPQPGAEDRPRAVMVDDILERLQNQLAARDARLLGEVEELAQALARVRLDIADLRAGDINAAHIPTATDELDAIVAHTAAATESILACCERLDRVASELAAEPAQALQEMTTQIYEACTFQDITGQRITKVIAALKAIEGKVAHILEVFAGDEYAAARRWEVPGSGLLNGPQLAANALHQTDIDSLLASFD